MKILIEVDHLQGVSTPYLQIKGTNKDIVTSAGSALSLDGSYTTKVWLGFLKSINAKHSYIYIAYFYFQFHGSLVLCRAIFKLFWRAYQLMVMHLLVFTINKLQGCRNWLSSSSHRYVAVDTYVNYLYTILGSCLDKLS